MFERLLSLFGRGGSVGGPATEEQARQAEATARQGRADVIDELHREGRQLQQAIKDESDALASSTTAAERAAHEDQIVTLQKALKQKQQELSKLQARI